MNTLIRFFDKVEDRAREKLSRAPIVYGVIGGTAIVMFWRGVWHTADMLEAGGGILGTLLGAPVSMVLSAGILLLTGLFVSFFIGDRIILSGLTREKKLEEKTENEVRAEGTLLIDMYRKLEQIEKELKTLKDENLKSKV